MKACNQWKQLKSGWDTEEKKAEHWKWSGTFGREAIHENQSKRRSLTEQTRYKETKNKRLKKFSKWWNQSKSRSDQKKKTKKQKKTTKNLSQGCNQTKSMKIRITHGTKRKEQRKQKNEHPKQALKRRNQSTSTKITIREEKKIRKEQKTNDE